MRDPLLAEDAELAHGVHRCNREESGTVYASAVCGDKRGYAQPRQPAGIPLRSNGLPYSHRIESGRLSHKVGLAHHNDSDSVEGQVRVRLLLRALQPHLSLAHLKLQ